MKNIDKINQELIDKQNDRLNEFKIIEDMIYSITSENKSKLIDMIECNIFKELSGKDEFDDDISILFITCEMENLVIAELKNNYGSNTDILDSYLESNSNIKEIIKNSIEKDVIVAGYEISNEHIILRRKSPDSKLYDILYSCNILLTGAVSFKGMDILIPIHNPFQNYNLYKVLPLVISALTLSILMANKIKLRKEETKTPIKIDFKTITVVYIGLLIMTVVITLANFNIINI